MNSTPSTGLFPVNMARIPPNSPLSQLLAPFSPSLPQMTSGPLSRVSQRVARGFGHHPMRTCPPALPPFWWEPLLGRRCLEERPWCGNGSVSEGTSHPWEPAPPWSLSPGHPFCHGHPASLKPPCSTASMPTLPSTYSFCPRCEGPGGGHCQVLECLRLPSPPLPARVKLGSTLWSAPRAVAQQAVWGQLGLSGLSRPSPPELGRLAVETGPGLEECPPSPGHCRKESKSQAKNPSGPELQRAAPGQWVSRRPASAHSS